MQEYTFNAEMRTWLAARSVHSATTIVLKRSADTYKFVKRIRVGTLRASRRSRAPLVRHSGHAIMSQHPD